MSRPPPDEQGYALVAAVASILVFAAIALAVIEAGRSSTIVAQAEVDRARLAASVEAGFALALAGLVEPGPAGPPRPDGRARQVRFDDATLTIAFDDESAKVPLNSIDRRQAIRLFSLLGVAGDRLDIVTDSFFDWLDDDDDARANGAEADYYASRKIRPRNGNLRSLAELGLIRGFDPALLAALAPIATVHFGKGSFHAENASLIAIEAVEGEDEGAIDLLNRRREIDGQSVALELLDRSDLAGRPLTIDVRASLPDGARRRERRIVVLTARERPGYVVLERN